ncbi:MAG: 16S rRNA (guanine(527)-N(7))-methyltransferase RsmG [Xanthomonadales bacterium]|nr:16S rRNA (guanine(527)-N(7))-methyltransferase RsmG [Xanthomonadales bacterium]
MSDRARLAQGLGQLGIEAGEGAMDRLVAYREEVFRWNRAYNLVGRAEQGVFIERHLLDCASVLPLVEGRFLLDVGSGAGLPGLVLAILRPSLECTLIDSARKKVRFLRHAARELGLGNVNAVHGRVESWRESPLPQTIVSRAFASVLDFAGCVRHLVTPGTRLVAMKGRQPGRELSGLPGWIHVTELRALKVPGLDAERHAVVFNADPETGE